MIDTWTLQALMHLAASSLRRVYQGKSKRDHKYVVSEGELRVYGTFSVRGFVVSDIHVSWLTDTFPNISYVVQMNTRYLQRQPSYGGNRRTACGRARALVGSSFCCGSLLLFLCV